MSELYLKLLRLEQETGMLRNINRALSEENALLKESLEKAGSAQQGERPLETRLFSFSLNAYIWDVVFVFLRKELFHESIHYLVS